MIPVTQGTVSASQPGVPTATSDSPLPPKRPIAADDRLTPSGVGPLRGSSVLPSRTVEDGPPAAVPRSPRAAAPVSASSRTPSPSMSDRPDPTGADVEQDLGRRRIPVGPTSEPADRRASGLVVGLDTSATASSRAASSPGPATARPVGTATLAATDQASGPSVEEDQVDRAGLVGIRGRHDEQPGSRVRRRRAGGLAGRTDPRGHRPTGRGRGRRRSPRRTARAPGIPRSRTPRTLAAMRAARALARRIRPRRAGAACGSRRPRDAAPPWDPHPGSDLHGPSYLAAVRRPVTRRLAGRVRRPRVGPGDASLRSCTSPVPSVSALVGLSLLVSLAGCGRADRPAIADPGRLRGDRRAARQRSGSRWPNVVSGDAGCPDLGPGPDRDRVRRERPRPAEPRPGPRLHLPRPRRLAASLGLGRRPARRSYVTDPSTYESLAPSPFVVSGQGPWAARVRGRARERLHRRRRHRRLTDRDSPSEGPPPSHRPTGTTGPGPSRPSPTDDRAMPATSRAPHASDLPRPGRHPRHRGGRHGGRPGRRRGRLRRTTDAPAVRPRPPDAPPPVASARRRRPASPTPAHDLAGRGADRRRPGSTGGADRPARRPPRRRPAEGRDAIGPDAPGPSQRSAGRRPGTNHVWSAGPRAWTGRSPGSRARGPEPPDMAVYRWGCAGANNVYLFAHAGGPFRTAPRPVRRGAACGAGMTVTYADANGSVHRYAVAWWQVVLPTARRASPTPPSPLRR